MSIKGLAILPAMAIGRFGTSPTPLEAYELRTDPQRPLDYRAIVPAETLVIDHERGHVARSYTPEHIVFRDGERIRPVAPFLEVFADTSDGLKPLTLDLLVEAGLGPEDLVWTVTVGNLKVFRQTGVLEDKVLATTGSFSDHNIHALDGWSPNFFESKSIPFGSVRYIRPTEAFPEIRLRFTPGTGQVYGSSLKRFEAPGQEVDDPVFAGDESRIVYDASRGGWRGFQVDPKKRPPCNPGDIYQGFDDGSGGAAIGWGYLDTVCDGRVAVELRADGVTLQASAWISACMPAFAPDSEPIRTVVDELEQLILGPDVPDEEVSIEEAAEIVRRALETMRHMNTMVMNGNVIDGRTNIAHTLITQDTNDFGRFYAPTMAPTLVDNLAVRVLHERIYAALLSGSAPWFASALRQPEEIGDLSDQARRKMPPMLRGADGRALALTRRQISKVARAAISGLFESGAGEA